MTYQNTFITVAPDTKATSGRIPDDKRAKKTLHRIQYELLTSKPYHYTHDELVFTVYVIRQGINDTILAEQGEELRADFFKKEYPCLRASALTKTHGWGAHYDHEGRIAIYPMESDTYQQWVASADKVFAAMRSKRA